jgi:hypothetical protein
LSGAARWSRPCPTCGKTLTYTKKQSMEKLASASASCRACLNASRPVSPTGEAIYEAHRLGLGNREIAAAVGCHHSVVRYWLVKGGLVSNAARGRPPEPVDDEHSKCARCGEVVRNVDFPWVRGRADGRRLSICRACRASDARRSIGENPFSYFNERERRMQNGERGGRPSRQGIAYALPEGYLVGLWVYQGGNCFYTGEPMSIGLGVGRVPSRASIDRVDPTKGYIVGNVVLCRTRINSIKSDVTIEELQEWMPSWHQQVVSRLPDLTASAKPILDGRELNAAGRRLPSWIVERRERLAALTGAK